MFDNSGLVKLHKMGVVMYSWIKNATKRKKGACPKRQKRKVQKVQKMLSLSPSAMDRLNHELAVQRDRFIRMESVKHDMALNLPHSIALPDGEELPYGSSTFLRIRDPEQEREIYDRCIRPPPNKTVFDGNSPPMLRANTGLFGRNSGNRFRGQSKKSGDLFDRTVRCFGMKRHEEPPPPPPPPPCVHVPCGRRRLPAFANNAGTSAASLPTVSRSVPPAVPRSVQPMIPRSILPSCITAQQTRQVVNEAHPADKSRSHSSGVAPGAAAAFAFAGTSAGAAATAAAGAAAAAAAAATASGSASHDGRAAKGREGKSEKTSV